MTTRRRPDKPLVKQCAEFVIFHLADKSAFAPFTGTDYDAWHAYVPTVRLWGRMRSADVELALRAIVGCAQRHMDVLAVFKKAIPCLLDWSDEVKLWPKIAPDALMSDTDRDLAACVAPTGMSIRRVIMPCPDGPRICHHERSKPYKFNTVEDGGYLECKDCGAIWKPRSVIQEAQ